MKRIIYCLLLLPLFAHAQQKGHNVPLINKDSIMSFTYDAARNWLFHEGDDPLMAGIDYNDSDWDNVNSTLRFKLPAKHIADTFSSIGWLRYHFIADTSITGIPLAFKVTQYGASEIYLDGKKLATYGTIKGKDSTVYYDPQYLPLVFVIRNQGKHVLAVRYANYNAKLNFERSHKDLAGFDISFGEAKRLIEGELHNSIFLPVIYALLFGFFIAFCMAHLFLYFFYRASKSNLYFSIFCLCLGAAFLIAFLNRFSHNPGTAMMDSFIGFIALCAGCMSFSGVTNSLFSVKQTRFKAIFVTSVLAPFILVINNKTGAVVAILLVLFVFIEAIVLTISAIRRKIQGARIIGAGILFFTLFILSNIAFAIIHGDDVVDGTTLVGQIYLCLTAFAIISMPIFMSLYLARDFAHVNKSLKKQLHQVELLSAQTLAQEQEKQLILEGQKEMLEKEVAARTTEVVAQKEKIEKQHDELKTEKKKSDDLLLNILPAEVAEELKEKGFSQARLFDPVTVLFTDFVDFTNAGERMSPEELVNELHNCFKAFDEIISKYGIEKIKTIGDAYLAVCGLPEASQGHAVKVAAAALDIVQFMTERRQLLGEKTFEIRLGIHSGSVVAGIVGVKKFAYDIWGDTVNTAARLEQHSAPGKINISESTYELVKDKFSCTYRGKISAKNKGELSMYFIDKPL